MMTSAATILITTKDRKDELRRALASAVCQSGRVEILVFDDGSTDGTSEMIKLEYPSVRYERSEISLGIVAARNRAMFLASGSIVITIDDDCVFQSRDTIERTLDDFSHAEIGAVAISHVNVNSSLVVQSRAPDTLEPYVQSEFTGCANAVRRDLFLRLGGFNEALWRQCEEYDFCTRLLDSGYVTRCGSAAPIFHYESLNRNTESIAFHIARGHLIYAWCVAPSWALGPHVAVSAMKCLYHAYKARQLKSAIAGLTNALSTILYTNGLRHPVDSSAYLLMRRLRKCGPLPLSSLAASLRDREASRVAM